MQARNLFDCSRQKQNPFSQNRFEHENKHLYYLPEEIYNKIEQPKPVYLIGTRGTGKTTLLKSMSWDERASNIFLQQALNNETFKKRYLGIYIKFAGTIEMHKEKLLITS